jgi:hypothetical protein
MSRGREAGVLLSRRRGRIGWTLLWGALLLVGCGKTRQPIEPSSLLAYNDAAIAARLGQRLGIQSSTSVGQEILLTRTDGRVLKVRPTTVVYVEDTSGKVHQFYPPFEVSLEGETLTITMDGTDPVSFSRAELAELFVQL